MRHPLRCGGQSSSAFRPVPSGARGCAGLRVSLTARETHAPNHTRRGNAVTDTAPLDPYVAAIEGPSPCDRCRNAPRCGSQQEACAAFSLYVQNGSEARWRSAPRTPARELFQRIFTEGMPAKAPTPKRPRLLTAEERRLRNTQRKRRWREQQPAVPALPAS